MGYSSESILSMNYPMNTNMAGFRWFSKSLPPCALGESSLSIGKVKDFDQIVHFEQETWYIYTMSDEDLYFFYQPCDASVA